MALFGLSVLEAAYWAYFEVYTKTGHTL